MTTTTTNRLERETCSRCGGSGQYSYCQMYGTTCFKCGGKKEVLTKRGQAAMAYLKGLRSKRAADLSIGDKVYSEGGIGMGNGGWATVTEIRPGNAEQDGGAIVDGKVIPAELTVTTDLCRYMTSADRTFRVFVSKDHEAETLAQALAYQETLTKAGTPRKR